MLEIDSLRKQLVYSEAVLEKQDRTIKSLNSSIEKAQQTIEAQSNLIAGFGTLYTALSGVLTLSAVLIPILTYYFAIRPSRKAVKKMEKIIDKRVDRFISKNRNVRIKKLMSLVNTEDIIKRNNAITELANIHDYCLKESQILKLIQVFKNMKTTDFSIKFQLTHLLVKYQSENIDEFVKQSLSQPDVYGFSSCIHYSLTKNFFDFLPFIVTGINSLPNSEKGMFLIYVFNEYIQNNSTKLGDLLNNTTFANDIQYNSPIHTDPFLGVFVEHHLQEVYQHSSFYKQRILPQLGK